MKLQYCWDARDYIKYEVLESLRFELGSAYRLTCLWMLTPDVGGSHGQAPFVSHPELKALTELFDTERALGRKDLRVLRDFFGDHYTGYGDTGPPFFSNIARRHYFESVPKESLRRAIVFLDPDTGMEPRSGRMSAAHLGFEDLAGLLARLDQSSLAVVFQYTRHEVGFWKAMALELEVRLSCPVSYVVSPPVGLYVIAKGASTLPAIERALRRVSGRAEKRIYGGPVVRVGWARPVGE